MNVLVTGGAGFIGSHLTDELVRQGHRVTVLDDLTNGSLDNLRSSLDKGCRFVKGDVLSTGDCQRAVESADAVFHLACLGVRHSLHSPCENARVNAEGTLNVLEAAANRVRRFFYVSTSEVYGGVDSFPITETARPNPFTVYGASKLAGEHYAQAYRKSRGLDACVIRLFNNYGPRAHHEGDAGELIPRAIVSVLNGRKPILFGDGTATRDFFYVKDTARALCELLAVETGGGPLNVGTGVERTIASVIADVLRLLGRESLGVRRLDSRPADVPRLWVDAGKFYALTGFKAAYSFEEGLAETIAHYRTLHEKGALRGDIPVKNWERVP